MRALLISLIAVGLLGVTGCVTKPTSKGPMQTAKNYTFKKVTTSRVQYLLYLPAGYTETSNKKWPLILFLHGAGERGTNVWKVATHGPPKLAPARPADFPFIIVSPLCPENQIWSNDVLLGLLEEVIRNEAVDTSRIYLTGLSMGGYGSWNLGLSYPEKFAAIVPICGGGQMITVLLSSRDKAEALKSLGIWAFHGGKDPVVPLSESQRMVDALKKAGVRDLQFTVYPEAGHNSWTEAYENPKLYEWLLEHHR